MSDELKPCPLCGSDAERRRMLTAFDDIAHSECRCSNLKCFMSQHYIPILEWQLRPIEDALRAKLAQARETIKKVNEYVGEIHESCHEHSEDINVAHCHVMAEITLDELEDALQKLGD